MYRRQEKIVECVLQQRKDDSFCGLRYPHMPVGAPTPIERTYHHLPTTIQHTHNCIETMMPQAMNDPHAAQLVKLACQKPHGAPERITLVQAPSLPKFYGHLHYGEDNMFPWRQNSRLPAVRAPKPY